VILIAIFVIAVMNMAASFLDEFMKRNSLPGGF